MKKEIKVAVAQFYSDTDVIENLRIATGYISNAAKEGARLIVMPENSNRVRDYKSREEAWQFAETVDGEFISGLQEAARQYGMFVACGVDIRGRQAPDVHIAVVLIDPNGQILHIHHKTVFWDYEYDFFVPGTKELEVIETEIGRIGLLSCADGIVPEVPRILALKGAQILANSLNSRGPDEMRVHEPLRAIENHVWHLAANTVGGPDNGYPWTGGSQIISPTGEIIANAGETEEGMVVGTITPETSHPKVLNQIGLLEEFRRPDLYRELLDPVEFHDVDYGPVAEDAPKIPLNVAVLQTSWYHATSWTLHRAVQQIAYAAKKGSTVGVFPELFIFKPGEVEEDPAKAAELSTKVLEQISKAAKENSFWVAINLVEADGDKFYSTLFLIDSEGVIVSKYRKSHLNKLEKLWATAGNEFVVVDTPIGTIGLMIGDEVWLPEVARILALRGAQVILHPTSWDRIEAATQAATERTEENRVHLVSSARTDNPANFGSQIVQADRFFQGQPIALMRYPTAIWSRTGFEENIFYELDLQDANSKMMGFNLDPLATRQPELYEVLAQVQK